MKKTFFSILTLLLLMPDRIFACDVCQKNQPKGLKGITHGTGPQGDLDYIIIWCAAIIVVITLFLSVLYLVKPKEKNANHVKNIVTTKI